MKRLKVTHYLQDPCCCSIAASATAANYYNPDISYEFTKELATKKISQKAPEEGLESVQICKLLNNLGFYNVALVTSNLDLVDYEWQGFGRKKMIKILEESSKVKKDRHDKMLSELSASFASKDEAAFSATMEKLSKMGEVLGEGTDEDASNYLASFAVDESDDVGEKKAELSSLSEQVKNIETMLSSVLSGNKVIKLGEPAPAVDDEQVEKKLFNDLDKIVETLKKSHEKYGG